jgi:transposase
MSDASVVEWIREKYIALAQDLDERGRRRWAATEARSLGWGGITAVAEATGMSDRTIRNGIKELDDPNAAPANRQRRIGAGRWKREDEEPELLETLESLVEGGTRGDPMSPLRWTCKSTRVLAKELKRYRFQVSSTKVGQLLKSQGYSLQANRKTVEGNQHPDRNAQFEHIAARINALLRTGQPAISVDTKKKENLGNMKNPGKTYGKKKQPRKVKTHDFPEKELRSPNKTRVVIHGNR